MAGESLHSHIYRMMYDSGSCSCASDGWGDTMRHNCLTEAASISAVIVRLFNKTPVYSSAVNGKARLESPECM